MKNRTGTTDVKPASSHLALVTPLGASPLTAHTTQTVARPVVVLKSALARGESRKRANRSVIDAAIIEASRAGYSLRKEFVDAELNRLYDIGLPAPEPAEISQVGREAA